MKNINYLRRGAMLFVLLTAFFVRSGAQEVNVYAYAFESEPALDGVIDESWSANEFQQIAHILTENQDLPPEDFSGSFKISWYENDLYFLFVVTDDILKLNTGYPIWYGDNINLYLDLGNEKSPEYDNNDYLCHFKWGNSDYYERYNGSSLIPINNSPDSIEFAQTCDTINHNFVMEIAIRNLAALNGPSELNESTAIGLDVSIFDTDEEWDPGLFTEHLSWVDTTGLAWSDPSRLGTTGFGTITLKSAQSPDKLNHTGLSGLIKVYPTLTSDYVYIETPESEGLHAELISLLGNKVATKDLEACRTVMDVSALTPGMYILRVADANGVISARRIVVSR